MTHTEIVKKLIGNINPIGESHIDKERFESLKEMCDLVSNLVSEIKYVARDKNRNEHSMKEMGIYASNFLISELEIND